MPSSLRRVNQPPGSYAQPNDEKSSPRAGSRGCVPPRRPVSAARRCYLVGRAGYPTTYVWRWLRRCVVQHVDLVADMDGCRGDHPAVEGDPAVEAPVDVAQDVEVLCAGVGIDRGDDAAR